MKSDEVEERIRDELEERGLNPVVQVKKRDRDFICKFYHVEESDEEDVEWEWKSGAELVYYGQSDAEFLDSLERKVNVIEESASRMQARDEFPSEEFLEWVEEHDEYAISLERVEEEYPSFFEAYNLTGITMKMDDDGKPLVPIRDLRDCVRLGYCRD